MQFTSFTFVLFAALVICLYYLAPGKLQWMVLLAASYFFYLYSGTSYLFFILFTTATTYLATILMARNLEKQDAYLALHKQDLSREEKKEFKARTKKTNKIFLIACLVLNFGILAICKASLLKPVAGLLQESRFSFLSLGLPLGISFYMFQSMGYLVDVYWGTAKAEKNPAKLALFVSFFPQLIQGPISKFSDLAPQLFAARKFDGKTLSFGLQRILWGFFKKMVIADRIAVAIGTLRGDAYTGFGFFLLMVFYALQLYGDFTGGIDITIGLAQCLGIRLQENFVRPFFSKNIAEYWRRWHISLGEWMKSYVFYPISVSAPMRSLSKFGRKRFGDFGKRLPIYVATVASWLATGIWHGFTPNFILWGVLNCFVIITSEELAPLYQKFHARFPGLKEKHWYSAFEMLRLFFLMNFIRVCDLFADVGEYFRRVGSLFTTWNIHILWDGTMLKLGLTLTDYIILLFGVGLLFAVSLLQERGPGIRQRLQDKPLFVRHGLIFLLLVLVLLLGSYGIGYDSSNFIYNQF